MNEQYTTTNNNCLGQSEWDICVARLRTDRRAAANNELC